MSNLFSIFSHVVRRPSEVHDIKSKNPSFFLSGPRRSCVMTGWISPSWFVSPLVGQSREKIPEKSFTHNVRVNSYNLSRTEGNTSRHHRENGALLERDNWCNVQQLQGYSTQDISVKLSRTSNDEE